MHMRPLIKLFSVPQHLRDGWLAEQIALLYLMLRGYRPLRRNWRGGGAEVDLLVWKRDVLVVVEVKYRATTLGAHHALGPAQAKRLQHQAQRLRGRYPNLVVRGDVLLVYPRWPFIEHHPQALALDS